MDLWAKGKQFFQTMQLSGAISEETKARQGRDHVNYDHIATDDDATDLKDDLFKSRSIDEILDAIGLRLFHLKAFLLLGLLNMTDSLEVSIISIILPSLISLWNLSPLLAGILTLSISAGMVVGSPFWGWVSDKYGRKGGFYGSATIIIVFAFASAFSINYYWLWISLFIVGFGMSSINQVYVMNMELFPPRYRSMFTGFISVFWTFGFLLSSIASMELSVIGFRWALAIVCFPTAIFLVGIVFLPETPHYYLASGDEQEALNVLQDFAPEMDLSNTTLLRGPESKRADIAHLFRSGYWKITTCACVLAFTSIMTYYILVFTASDVAGIENNISIITGFQKTEMVHYSSSNLYLILTWMNLPELVILCTAAICCYIFTVKYIILTLLILAIILQVAASFILKQRIALLVLTMLCRSLLMTEVTVVYIYASLLYPTANRGIGVGTCLSAGRMGIAVGPFVFETLFVQAYFNGIVFNVGVLLIAFISTALLPPRSPTLS